MVVRSRTRNAQKSGNPFIMLGVAAALVGLGLISLAGWYYVSQREKRVHRVRMIRGLALLEKLTPLATDYYYSGKGLADKPEPLPPEKWAAFKEQEGEADFVDAMITKTVGKENHFADAFRYKTGKTAQGEPIPGNTRAAKIWFYPEDRQAPDDQSVQVIEGRTTIGGVERSVIMIRRSIMVGPSKPGLEYGKALIILLADVPCPEPGAAAGPATPPAGAGAADAKAGDKPADKPGNKDGAKPDDKAGAKPDQKPATETGTKQ